MNVTEFIDETTGKVDNVSPANGDSARRRARHLSVLIAVFAYVYFIRDWWFRSASPTLTVPASTGYVELPSGFLTVAYKGGIYLNSTGHRLRHVSQQEITNLREGPAPLITDEPQVYSIFGQGGNYRPLLQIPMNASELTFKAWVDNEAPTLDESANITNLKVIPERWHRTVLFPGVRAELQAGKGDARYSSFIADAGFQAGLAEMIVNEKHGKESPGQLPGFFGVCE